jgi:hypothetical protein
MPRIRRGLRKEIEKLKEELGERDPSTLRPFPKRRPPRRRRPNTDGFFKLPF